MCFARYLIEGCGETKVVGPAGYVLTLQPSFPLKIQELCDLVLRYLVPVILADFLY